MKSKLGIFVAIQSALFLIPTVGEARTSTLGYVRSLQHYSGHSGVLVKLEPAMIDPDSCGRSDWYIMPDNSPHAQFVQAMLLSAQASQRQVTITLDGCLDGLPQVLAIGN